MKKQLTTIIITLLFAPYLIAQQCQNDLVESTPSSRFSVNGDGTVTDNITKLMWMRCSLGQEWDGNTCIGSTWLSSWGEAFFFADDNNFFAGKDDWRLANIKELSSIIETSCYRPAINSVIFPNTPFVEYWSSSPLVNNDNQSWAVDFQNGKVDNESKLGTGAFRLVRDVTEPTDEVEQPVTINIVDTWNYSISYASCPNQTEQGTATWTYHIDGYGMSTHSDNGLDPDSCNYIGAYSTNGNAHFLTDNPITTSGFKDGLNDYSSSYYWENVIFESVNSINVTGIYNGNNTAATFIFTR